MKYSIEIAEPEALLWKCVDLISDKAMIYEPLQSPTFCYSKGTLVRCRYGSVVIYTRVFDGDYFIDIGPKSSFHEKYWESDNYCCEYSEKLSVVECWIQCENPFFLIWAMHKMVPAFLSVVDCLETITSGDRTMTKYVEFMKSIRGKTLELEKMMDEADEVPTTYRKLAVQNLLQEMFCSNTWNLHNCLSNILHEECVVNGVYREEKADVVSRQLCDIIRKRVSFREYVLEILK